MNRFTERRASAHSLHADRRDADVGGGTGGCRGRPGFDRVSDDGHQQCVRDGAAQTDADRTTTADR